MLVPSTCCMYSGSRMRVPNSDIIETSMSTRLTVKVGNQKARTSSSAKSLSASWRHTNTARAAAPIPTGIHGEMRASPLAASPIELRPKMSPAKPTAESTPEKMSSGMGRGSVTLRMSTAPATSATIPMGRTDQNIHRQLRTSRTRPPIVGPIAGATAITMEMTPIVRPRRSAGTTLRTVVMSNGIMIAVPTACTTRPATSIGNTTANEANSVPPVNVLIAMTNTIRSGNRTSSHPVNGMTTAIVSMKAVVSHCAVAAVTANSTMSSGSATDMMVSLRITTNAAPTSRAMRRTVAAGSGGEASAAAGAAALGLAETSDVTVVLWDCGVRKEQNPAPGGRAREPSHCT